MDFKKSTYLRIAVSTIFYFLLKLQIVKKINLPGIRYSFKVRKGTSDTGTFRQVFKEDQYRFRLKGVETVVDAGANIGLASIVFSNQFPNAQIVAIEPDKENYELLEKNVNRYNVRIIRGGVWNKNTHLEIEDHGGGEWAYTVREVEQSSDQSIPAISLDEIMKTVGFKTIDLLKIDIEGSEKDVFMDGYESWLPCTKYIIIEMHDHMKKGASKSVFKAISNYNFSFKSRRENLLFTNEDMIDR